MLLRRLIQFITPVDCLSCGREGDLLCAYCVENLPRRVSTCYRCNRLTTGYRVCPTCRRHSNLLGVAVGAYYDGTIKELILKLKFERSASVASALARLISRGLDQAEFDLVTAIPVSPHRQRERGYNQAELIARSIAGDLKLPYRSLLVRTSSDHQMGRSRSERLAKVGGAFSPLRSASGLRVLLIDDVLTTGATVEEAARVLRRSGAASVMVAVAARHRS